MEISAQHEAVLEKVKETLYPWRKLTIAVDGADGAGKSPLSRYLAWQLRIPLIETDLLLISDTRPIQYNLECLKELIGSRHSLDRPVLIEGIKILDTLSKLNIESDILIFVENLGYPGTADLENEIQGYLAKYKPKEKANFVYVWEESVARME